MVSYTKYYIISTFGHTERFDQMHFHFFTHHTGNGTWRTEKSPKIVKTLELLCITKLDASILAGFNPIVTDIIIIIFY